MSARDLAKPVAPTVRTRPPARVITRIVPSREAGRGLLAGMRIRKKLFVLHTFFSLALTLILLVAIRPAIARILDRADSQASMDLLSTLVPDLSSARAGRAPRVVEFLGSRPHVVLKEGSAIELDIPRELAVNASTTPGRVLELTTPPWEASAVVFVTPPGASEGRYIALSTSSPAARAAVTGLYTFTLIALLVVYALVVIALENFVLPQAVYDPIRRVLAADRAVQENKANDEELVPEIFIPQDELGEIMRSRNDSVRALRRNQHALNEALAQLESAAGDLKKKNHLLETAQRNLADADRLASLGMMSAGIAHELNTPLAVIKGSVEQIAQDPSKPVEPARATLMLRVVERLERLSESLLDFARVRPPRSREVAIASLVDEAATLVRLDRSIRMPALVNRVPASLETVCDPDRMTQVLVNLIRNAADAMASSPSARTAEIVVEADETEKDGQRWLSLRIRDTGPGISPAILSRLFEPFASTRLDSRGTGLGLAVAEGIVREHGGVLLARNIPGPDQSSAGAVFEILLPQSPRSTAEAAAAPISEYAAGQQP
jgi:C4-dicarboxylate-specific signal transduction histidine kinase